MSEPLPDPLLPDDPDADLDWLDAEADRFDSAWARGERPRIEDHLPPAGPRRDALLPLLLEIELERLGGLAERPDAAAYEARFPADAAAVRAVFARAAVPPGTTIPDPFPGEFRVVRYLGGGGGGEVWLAQDLNLARLVALKTLRFRGPPRERDARLDDLRREAAALVRLRHPNIVQVHAWRAAYEGCFLVLQYVAGGSLADRLKANGPLDWRPAARYIADVAEGLGHVHALGIVHRDIKPGNILWDPDRDEALLTDFGVAALHPGELGVAGTYAYMAPEGFDGRVAASLDVYGLAATLFHLVTGSPPFPGPEPADYLAQVAAGLAEPDPREAALPPGLARLVRAGLAAEPGRRPGLRAFTDDLRAELNRNLVDDLAARPAAAVAGAAGVALELRVGRLTASGAVEPLAGAATAAPGLERIRLRTGDRIAVAVSADRDGYLTVFNLGPTGNLNLLHPESPQAAPAPVAARRTLRLPEIELVPPSGRERLFAVWSARPLPLGPADLRTLADPNPAGVSAAYCTTRDLKRVRDSVLTLAPDEWRARGVELDHRPPGEAEASGD